MWLSMLVLVVSGFIIAGIAAWLGGAWADKSGPLDAALPLSTELHCHQHPCRAGAMRWQPAVAALCARSPYLSAAGFSGSHHA
jgi:hypothetical protein